MYCPMCMGPCGCGYLDEKLGPEPSEPCGRCGATHADDDVCEDGMAPDSKYRFIRGIVPPGERFERGDGRCGECGKPVDAP